MVHSLRKINNFVTFLIKQQRQILFHLNTSEKRAVFSGWPFILPYSKGFPRSCITINISDIKILFVYNPVEIKIKTLLTRRICIMLFLDNPGTVQVKYEFV